MNSGPLITKGGFVGQLTPTFRKLNLTAHIASSVGWLGSVAAFLVLSIAGLISQNVEIVRGAYISMNLLGQFLIVPLSFATLVTGLILSLGTHWGLVRYYWVLVKFALTIGATSLLLLHQFTAVSEAAKRVSDTAAGTLPEVGQLASQLVGDAGFAVLVLLVNTILSVYKPWGKTRYGHGEQFLEAAQPLGMTATNGIPLRFKIFLAVIAVLVLGFITLHLSSGSFVGHSR